MDEAGVQSLPRGGSYAHTLVSSGRMFSSQLAIRVLRESRVIVRGLPGCGSVDPYANSEAGCITGAGLDCGANRAGGRPAFELGPETSFCGGVFSWLRSKPSLSPR